MAKKIFKYFLILCALYLTYACYQTYQILDEAELFKEPVFETQPPTLPASFQESPEQQGILVFSKTNGFRHHEAIAAANHLFAEFAAAKAWPIFFTENAAVHNPEQLARFKVIIWNNNTNDVLNQEQQTAFKNYIEGGGHWLGIHGAGGSRSYEWQWYPEQLLKAQFIGHPMKHLGEHWQREEEWYSFDRSVRNIAGVEVLASLDESSYNPGSNLLMDNDHPLIWTYPMGKGIVFYSALGHKGSAYQEPEYKQLLENALQWLMQQPVN
jgi:type 1 glutamine amidotransferase